MIRHCLFLISLLIAGSLQAQVLVKDHIFHPQQYNQDYYDVEPSFVFKQEFNIDPPGFRDGKYTHTLFNIEHLTLPQAYASYATNHTGYRTEGGYYVVAEGVNEYDQQESVLLLYDKGKKVVSTFNLTDMTRCYGNVMYIDQYKGRYYFNIESPTHMVGGPENYAYYMLYCLDPVSEHLLWESDCCTSRYNFIIQGDYIFAGYGGADESDFVHLLDLHTGLTLSTSPIPSEPTAVGLAGDSIYFTDYSGRLYRYLLADRGVQVMGDGVRLRRGPSTSDEIFTDPFTQKVVYPLNGDILAYLGEVEDWYKVSFYDQELYISKKFSFVTEGSKDSFYNRIYKQWNDQIFSDSKEIVRHPIHIIPIDIDGSEHCETLLVSDERACVFTGTDEKPVLVTDGETFNIRIFPSLHCVHYYFGLSTGDETESIYFLKDDAIEEIWTHTSVPHGNVWTEGEVAVDVEYTKTIRDKETQCTEEEFWQKKSLFDDITPFDISESFDL